MDFQCCQSDKLVINHKQIFHW